VAIVFVDASFESIRRSYKPRFTSWGLFGAPIDYRARYLPRLPGGVVEGLVIPRQSPRRAQAVAFARWLTEPTQQVALSNGSSALPATRAAASSSRLQPHLRMFAAVGMPNSGIDMRVYESPRVLAVLYSGVRGILAGTNTPTVTARRTQAAKGR
jgi:ABC-type glycerol-3-phosphate transport system substrate-binding protein